MAEAPVITRAEERPRVAPRRRRRRRLRRGLQPLPWLAPSLVLILGIVVYPVFEMARTSLFDVNISGLTTRFVGLRNYGRILTDGDLAHILSNSAKWVGLIVGLTMLISLALAQLLNQQFPGRRWVRWALIVPWATSLVITASAWKWMLNFYYGIV